MRVASAHSVARFVDDAACEAFDGLRDGLGGEPSVVFLYATVGYEPERLAEAVSRVAPAVRLHGGTSCVGVMTESGFHSVEGRALGLLGILDPDGAYGTGIAPIEGDARAAASRAIEAALVDAGRQGETPAMVWLTTIPGVEERVIRGIEDVLGPRVPIAGGSAADDAVEGRWAVFAKGAAHRSAVVATALFPSSPVCFNFHSGYAPTARKGRVTRAEGRALYTIDGRPAARVYDEWTGGTIAAFLERGGNVLGRTTLRPLGRVAGEAGGVPYYLLAHPDRVEADGSLHLFSDIAEGDDLVLMTGTSDSLVSRAGRVARSAMAMALAEDVAGALVCYCGGCMLAVRDRMGGVVQSLGDALSHKPFLGAFTFGEQGCSVGGENRHGNLMISSLVFSRGAGP